MYYDLDPEGYETTALHELVDFAGTDVLEVGCGDGRMTWRYADEAATVLAVDSNGMLIERAVKATPDRLRSKVRFLEANINQIDLPSEAFHIALLAYSL
ncbi:MAG TPA: class I SAM-dependent methyltransferase [Acidimicrobiia bacterium]|jgi:ubiquinone/menaquinone biosynthesis C-methylase UbiE|nr:class I SAM-dependent methyltransferase [Acidimicrobiia bacterium]